MKWLQKLFGLNKQPVIDIDVEKLKPVETVGEVRKDREMSYREAFVVYESGYKRKGIVLDYTGDGVRLRFPTNERVPDDIVLNARSVGLHGAAKVVWQKGSEVGVQMQAA